MKSWDKITILMIASVAFCMLIAVMVGWNMSKNYTALANERNAIKQTTNVNLEVIDKGIEGDILGFLPKRYYLILPNDTKIYVTKKEHEKYEQGHSYDFEQMEQSLVTQQIRTYKDNE